MLPKLKFFLLFYLLFINGLLFSQVKNKQQLLKISGKAYSSTKSLTGMQGAYSDNPARTTYISSDSVIIRNKKLTFINQANKKYTTQTNQKGSFTISLPPGKYVVLQPESDSVTPNVGFGEIEVTILNTKKHYILTFYNIDDSQNTIPSKAD